MLSKKITHIRWGYYRTDKPKFSRPVCLGCGKEVSGKWISNGLGTFCNEDCLREMKRFVNKKGSER